MKKNLFITVMTLTIGFAAAQNHHIFGLFPTYNLNVHLSEKWDASLYSFAAIYPFEQTTAEFPYEAKTNAFYTELDAIYKFNEAWSFAGSYTYERVNTFRSDYRNEHRLWLQVQHYHKFEKVNLKNRIRYDFRWIDFDQDGTYTYNPRLRYLIGIDFPLNSESLYFAAYNEVFFNTSSNMNFTYEENWAFAGVGFNISKKSKLETGPLLISWIRNPMKDWLNQYFWQATLISTIGK